jgi:hypothetical protein
MVPKMSRKQKIIMGALATKQSITLQDAVRLIGGNIYINAEKHTGALLSNMVKRGMIVRLKPGVFASK